MLIHNFNERQYVTEIGRLAWGYIEYDKPLENEDIDGYELIPAAFFLIKKASRNMYTWKNGNYQHVGANIQKSIKIDTETMEIGYRNSLLPAGNRNAGKLQRKGNSKA